MGTLPVKDHEDAKRTNEIKMAIPLLATVDIEGQDVTADALLTQRKIAEYLVTERQSGPLSFHCQRKPEKPAGRYRLLVPRSQATRLHPVYTP